MESEEGGKAVLDHKVVLVGPPAEEGHSFEEEGKSIRAWGRGELLCGTAGLEGANQVGEAVRVVRG